MKSVSVSMKIIHYSKIEPRRFDSDMVKGVTGNLGIGKVDGKKISKSFGHS
jgi:hypothetical protein